MLFICSGDLVQIDQLYITLMGWLGRKPQLNQLVQIFQDKHGKELQCKNIQVIVWIVVVAEPLLFMF